MVLLFTYRKCVALLFTYSSAWCYCIPTAVCDVIICLQQCVALLFTYSSAWCYCLPTAVCGVIVCLLQYVVLLFTYSSVWCYCLQQCVVLLLHTESTRQWFFGVDYSAVSYCLEICNKEQIIIMYIYHALIKSLSAHMIHINLNMIFYTHVEHSPNKTICIKYYKKY